MVKSSEIVFHFLIKETRKKKNWIIQLKNSNTSISECGHEVLPEEDVGLTPLTEWSLWMEGRNTLPSELIKMILAYHLKYLTC